MRNLLNRIQAMKALDLQVKIILILIGVILPTSFLLSLAQSRLMAPVLDEEIRQVGLSFTQLLASQIEAGRLLQKSNPTTNIEDRIQRLLYSQPSIIRVDVYAPDPEKADQLKVIASSVDEADLAVPPTAKLLNQPITELAEEEGVPAWRIEYPVKSGSDRAVIHALVSLRLMGMLRSSILKFNVVAALVSTVFLILLLSFFLRRAIENEKQLQVAQASNEQLTGRLQEIQQELIHKEKLAVMGQLTASFAHEIGTPLNAIGGHMQLLQMDLDKQTALPDSARNDRMGIILSQLHKIETIVKRFLQTTKNPVQEQRSVVSIKQLFEGILALVMPTLQRHHITFGQEYLATQDQVKVVPIEIEQVILNLINNAIDSMKGHDSTSSAKRDHALFIRTRNAIIEHAGEPPKTHLTIEIQDTGAGISDENLKQIFKPFFTTKKTGEGHGLGLSICQDIIRSYGGDIHVQSKLGQGTLVTVELQIETTETLKQEHA